MSGTNSVAAITDPLGVLMTNAGISAKTTTLATTLVAAVPSVISAGLAVGQVLAPSIAALRDVAQTGREPTDAELATVLAHIQENVLELQRLADPPAPPTPAPEPVKPPDPPDPP